MTNEELMQIMTDLGLHAGGMENWVADNAWLRVANEVQAREREACAKAVEQTKWSNWFQADAAAAIRARGQA